jgi:hypothetical protein
VTNISTDAPGHTLRPAALNAIAFGVIILAAAFFGIFTRPTGLLASFWPANAVMLGLMIRYPRFATPWCWVAATAGFLIADLATGGTALRTAMLTAGNLAGIAAGFLLSLRLPTAT